MWEQKGQGGGDACKAGEDEHGVKCCAHSIQGRPMAHQAPEGERLISTVRRRQVFMDSPWESFSFALPCNFHDKCPDDDKKGTRPVISLVEGLISFGPIWRKTRVIRKDKVKTQKYT